MDMNQNNQVPEQAPVAPVTPPPAAPVNTNVPPVTPPPAAPVNANVPPVAPPQKTTDGMAIASLVLGIVGFLLSCCWFLSIPASILAIIFSAISLKKGKNGMAIAGLILGAITLVSVLLFYVIAGASAMEGIRNDIRMGNFPDFGR